MANEPIRMGSVCADGRELHVVMWAITGRVAIRDNAHIHSGYTLHAHQARNLGEMLIAAADRSEAERQLAAARG